MSEIQVGQINSTDGSTAITTSSGNTTVTNNLTVTGGFVPSTQIGGRRNLIINGAMQVAQRGTSSTSTGYASVDRWKTVPFRVDTLVGTQSQSTDAPDGFSTSFKYNVDTAESLGGDEYFGVMHHVEAYNVQHLDYGTASAKSMTLSFWVKGSTTGTYAIQFYTEDSGRTIGATYTIDTADTWEYKTVSIVGDTAGSGIANNNGSGFRLFFILASGTNYTTTDNTSWDASSSARIAYNHSANPIATINNYWQITGVQLEVGTVATPFEHRSYGEELALCQRYYEKFAGLLQYSKARESDRLRYINFFYKQVKRATPDITLSGTADGTNFVNFADNSLDGFRGECIATGDGATPFFTSATFNSEL